MTDSWVHGKKLKEHLGFYDVQLEASKALWKAVHERYDIPLVAPESGDDDFLTSTKYESDVYAKRFRGFVSHYHQSRKKIDCANLDIVKMLDELRED